MHTAIRPRAQMYMYIALQSLLYMDGSMHESNATSTHTDFNNASNQLIAQLNLRYQGYKLTFIQNNMGILWRGGWGIIGNNGQKISIMWTGLRPGEVSHTTSQLTHGLSVSTTNTLNNYAANHSVTPSLPSTPLVVYQHNCLVYLIEVDTGSP